MIVTHLQFRCADPAPWMRASLEAPCLASCGSTKLQGTIANARITGNTLNDSKPVRQQIFARRVALGAPTFRTSSSVAFLSTSSICLASAEVIWADRKAEPAFSAVTPDLLASAQRWQPPPDPWLATAARLQPPPPRSREAGFRLINGRGESFDRTHGNFGCLQVQARQAAAHTARMAGVRACRPSLLGAASRPHQEDRISLC